MKNIQDSICQVYAGIKSKKTIDSVLEEYISGHEKLNLDYACKPDDKDYVFQSEDEMITYFIDNLGLSQTFYWKKYHDNPDNIMVGANITEDNKLIISLTIDGDNEIAMKYLRELKEFLNSNVGVISYVDPAIYEDGKDFLRRYGENAATNNAACFQTN